MLRGTILMLVFGGFNTLFLPFIKWIGGSWFKVDLGLLEGSASLSILGDS